MHSPPDAQESSADTNRWTDSPAFWVLLFATAALVGVTLIGPKYARRQALIERRFEVGREVARRKAEGETPLMADRTGDPQARDRELLVPLWPLIGLLIIVDAAAAGWLLWRRGRGNSLIGDDAPTVRSDAVDTARTERGD